MEDPADGLRFLWYNLKSFIHQTISENMASGGFALVVEFLNAPFLVFTGGTGFFFGVHRQKCK